MPECNVCNDTKFVERNGVMKECQCQLKKRVRQYLPDIFRKYPVAKNFDHRPFDKDLLFRGQLAKFGSLINSILVRRYLLNQKYTYELTTAYGFVEAFFEGDSNRFYECDLLVLLIYGGYKNKFAPDKMYTILKDRELTGKKTIVFIDKDDYPDSKVRDWYGAEFVSLIDKFVKVGA